MNLKLVIVPQWVQAAIKKAGASEKILMDVHALTSILSKGDVAFYVLLNNRLWNKIHPEIAGTFSAYDFFEVLHTHQDEEKEKLFNSTEFFKLHEKMALENPEPGLRELYLDEPKFGDNEEELRNTYFSDTQYHGYEIRAIADNVMAYFIKEEPAMIKAMADNPRVSAFEAVRIQRAATDKTLKTLMTYLSFEGVCKTPAFTHFTQLSRLSVEG